jgi:Ca2+-binding EF-hand superfamily protein
MPRRLVLRANDADASTPASTRGVCPAFCKVHNLEERIMLKTTLAISAFTLAAALALPGSSFADDHAARLDAAFKAADKDNDGTLTKEEATAMPRVAKNFDAIDTDHDGTVSMDEIKAAMKQAKQTMHEKGKAAFAKADADHDGTLDKEEAKAMPRVAKNFDAIDIDHDGTVSMDEIHAFMKAQHKNMQQ